MRPFEMTPETESQAQMNGAGPRPTTACHPGMDGTRIFDERPILIDGETTLACALACQHCRAEAQREPHPYQLSTDEGLALLDELKTFGDPLAADPLCPYQPRGGEVVT